MWRAKHEGEGQLVGELVRDMPILPSSEQTGPNTLINPKPAALDDDFVEVLLSPPWESAQLSADGGLFTTATLKVRNAYRAQGRLPRRPSVLLSCGSRFGCKSCQRSQWLYLRSNIRSN